MTNNPILQTIVKNQPYPVLFATLSGAHLYGFPSEDSDYDVRGAHCLPLDSVLRMNVQHETIQAERIENGIELDLVTHDIKPYVQMLLKKNGNVLEQILSPMVMHTSPEHDELRDIANNCITKFHAYHYLGFSRKKWDEFSKQTDKRIKTLLYIYRVLLTGIYLMRTGKLEANLSTLNDTFVLPYVPDLIAGKQANGEKSILTNADFAFHESEYQRLRGELETAKDSTHLPDYPQGEQALDDWLVRVRLQYDDRKN